MANINILTEYSVNDWVYRKQTGAGGTLTIQDGILTLTGRNSTSGESCFSCTKALTAARQGQHSIASCLPTSIATMDDENEMFSMIMKYVQLDEEIKFYAKEKPTADFQVQVVNY